MGEPRTQEQRDAATVEAMFALICALCMAGTVFAVVTCPALIFSMVHGEARRVLIVCGKGAGLAVFLAWLAIGTRRRWSRRS
ncbi:MULTISPECIES: DUF6332 family protein [unclassified Streptomyces]|uniref:DUF6332 family protein n=1 Tax=unclassified Streptomyces TaxID=2593676 RepID=UPI00135FAA38|nr:hypothetical protein EAO69_27430 [Streptomyces sp. me109]